ncbi:hypothetical protein ABR738_10665 [Streptomyces sp. Edi4]|uniref:hypothetical protein n=1 Tax=Streptomyces sp. Edi4 TaxID=3162527 RepID=UPI00330600FF
MRPKRRSRVRLILPGAFLAVAALAGCTAQPAGPSQAATRTGIEANSPSPGATSPQDLCVRLITYWARQELDQGKGSGLDYQEKGLSDGQNEILLAALAAARPERAAHGAAAGDRVVERRAREGCDERYRNGAPSGGPWAQTKPPLPSASR